MKRQDFLKLSGLVVGAPFSDKLLRGVDWLAGLNTEYVIEAVNPGPGYFHAGDLVRNTLTGEAMRITSITRESFTVRRAG